MPTLYDSRVHHRRSMRLESWDYTWAWWYYVTMCVQDRITVLGRVDGEEIRLSQHGEIARDTWLWLARHHEWVELDEFVIMPNHLHGILIMNNRRGGSRTAPTVLKEKPLGRLIGAFKTVSTKEINLLRGTPGATFWQRGFYDHIVRNDHDLHRIRTYIRSNPLHWAFDEENPDRNRSQARKDPLIQSLKTLAQRRQP